MTERTNRGSWRVDAKGDLEEKEKSDYADQYEQEKAALRSETPSIVKGDALIAPAKRVAFTCATKRHVHTSLAEAKACR